jgi:arginyl-tRNA synthetase
VSDPVSQLQGTIAEVASELRGDGAAQTATLARPPRPDFGDYSTNVAMMLAPALGQAPREVAERLGHALGQRLGPAVDRLEVAGPGFLNLFMADPWYLDALAGMLAAGERFGAGEPEVAEWINVEFVSANPTGPLTAASARHAAYGDALCRILELAGQRVEREYYLNDYGSQVRRFGDSIRARARGEEPPTDGYHGAYVTELAERIEGAAGAEPDELARRGVELMVEEAKATLDRFRVRLDRFTSERALHESGAIERALGDLEEREHVYPFEGAVWLRTTTFGDDKDRVLMRSSGEFTYFASDIAYHEDKLRRGYDRAIDVWGADHHGYVGRMRAAWQALGGDPERLELLIMQLVNLIEAGERARMSRRRGDFVTLDELVDDIGVDAARFFVLQRSHDTPLDLDLDLARRQSQDNPVYYVQYAHARIASILRRAGAERVESALAAEVAKSSETLHPSARALVKRLLEFPGEVQAAAARRAPHRITGYVHEAAQDFSAFYRDVRVLGAAEEGGDEDVRLALCVQTQRVIASALRLLGVSAPEEM